LGFLRQREKHRHQGAPQIFKMALNKVYREVNQDFSFILITQARYALNQGLAGLVTYMIDTDDFLPECSNVRYPLLRNIHSEFNAASNDKQGDKMRTAGSSVVLSLFCNAIIFQFTENNFIILNRNQQRASV
jgi:hypothetical protein